MGKAVLQRAIFVKGKWAVPTNMRFASVNECGKQLTMPGWPAPDPDDGQVLVIVEG